MSKLEGGHKELRDGMHIFLFEGGNGSIQQRCDFVLCLKDHWYNEWMSIFSSFY
jgi:hypothetical protein